MVADNCLDLERRGRSDRPTVASQMQLRLQPRKDESKHVFEITEDVQLCQ